MLTPQKQECKLNPKQSKGNKQGRNSINLKTEEHANLMKPGAPGSLKDQ